MLRLLLLGPPKLVQPVHEPCGLGDDEQRDIIYAPECLHRYLESDNLERQSPTNTPLGSPTGPITFIATPFPIHPKYIIHLSHRFSTHTIPQ